MSSQAQNKLHQPSDFIWHLNRYTSIEFGQQHYDFIARLWSWSRHKSVRGSRQGTQINYTMGVNEPVLKAHAGQYGGQFLSSNGDATRVKRAARRRGALVVGKCDDPDPSKWASTWQVGLPVSKSYLELIEMWRIIRSLNLLAHEMRSVEGEALPASHSRVHKLASTVGLGFTRTNETVVALSGSQLAMVPWCSLAMSTSCFYILVTS